MGVALIELKQYTQAVLSLIKALQLQSEDARAYNNIGVAYAALGQYDSAIEHLQQAIEIEPNNASAHFNLGIVFSRLDKHNKAVNHFSRIIHESEDDIQSSPLEVLYAQLRQPGNLFMTPQQVLAIQSDEEVKAHSVFAEALSGKSQYEAAILSYKKAIELQPDNAMAYYNLGKLYFKHHQELQGIECFSKVIELQPDDKIYQKTLDTIISIGDGRVVEPLIFALNSNDKYSRFVSVSKLGEIGDERAIKPLIELLDDSDEVMRQYAAKALIKLREKAVAPLILTAKSHKSAGVRWNAAYILRKIGTSDALRALEEIGKQGAEGKKEIKKRAFRRIRQEEGYSRKRSLWSIFGGR
jgi:tetratricopeptide (TPR) repeat protein